MINAKKNTATLTLRYPEEVKAEFKKIAKEEGMSENSALVQGLVWWLKFREKMQGVL